MEEVNNVQRPGASRNEMYWLIYQTVNLVNNKIYIGVHKQKDPYKFDNYIGEGVYITQPSSYMHGKTKFENAVRKYGVSNFKRTILHIFDNEDAAYNMEAELVNEEYLKRPDVYNMILGGKIPHMKKETKKVYQYSLNGKYITEFSSFQEAAKYINKYEASISEATVYNIAKGGYYWSTEKKEELDISNYRNLERPGKALYKYSITGEYLGEYKTVRSTGYSEASKAAILGYAINNQCFFSYIKAESYSKARDIYVKNMKIYQFDKDGKFLKEFTFIDALKEYPGDGISIAIRNKTITKSGHYWGIQKLNYYNSHSLTAASSKIGKYDLEGNLVKVYNSLSDCYNENGKNAGRVLNHQRKTHKGYIYKYIS